jgi:hypothetical protein
MNTISDIDEQKDSGAVAQGEKKSYLIPVGPKLQAVIRVRVSAESVIQPDG